MKADLLNTLVLFLEQAGGFILDRAPAVFGAFAILVVGWLVARRVSRWIRQALGKQKRFDATLKPLVASLAHYTIVSVSLLAALAQFGIPTASLLAVLGAVGLAIGLALQGTLSNIAAGVMLLTLRPLRVGEYIETPENAGTVIEMGLFTTELKTLDGLYLSVPNAKIWGDRVLNFDRYPVRRINIPVGVDYGTDLEHARTVLAAALEQHPHVQTEPESPVILVTEFADSSINLLARCWITTERWQVTATELRMIIKSTLDANDISIPFPQRVVHQGPAERE